MWGKRHFNSSLLSSPPPLAPRGNGDSFLVFNKQKKRTIVKQNRYTHIYRISNLWANLAQIILKACTVIKKKTWWAGFYSVLHLKSWSFWKVRNWFLMDSQVALESRAGRLSLCKFLEGLTVGLQRSVSCLRLGSNICAQDNSTCFWVQKGIEQC